MSYADILWQAGIGQAVIQRDGVSSNDVATADRLSIGMGLLIGAVGVLLSGPLEPILGVDSCLLILVCAVFPLNAFGAIPMALIQRELRFRALFAKDVVEVIVYGLTGTLLGFLGFGLTGLVVAVVAKALIGPSIARALSPVPRTGRFSAESARRLLLFGGGVSLARLLNTTARNADYLIVLWTMNAASLGLYSRAYQLVTIPANVIGQVIDRVFFPAFSRLQSDRPTLGRVFVVACGSLAATLLPLGVIFFFFAEEIVLLLLGPQWQGVVRPFEYLALFLFFRVAYKIGEPIAKTQRVAVLVHKEFRGPGCGYRRKSDRRTHPRRSGTGSVR